MICRTTQLYSPSNHSGRLGWRAFDDVRLRRSRTRWESPPPALRRRTNITFTCGATTLEPPRRQDAAGAAGIDLSVELSTAAQLEGIHRGLAISAEIDARSAAKGRLIKRCATRSRRARIAVRCYVC